MRSRFIRVRIGRWVCIRSFSLNLFASIPTGFMVYRSYLYIHIRTLWTFILTNPLFGFYLARPVQSCPITGKIPAPYKEPTSGVAFGDVTAYKVLMELLDHGYVWSPRLGCYVGKDEKILEGDSGWPQREEEEEEEEGEGGEKEVEVVRRERLGGRLRAL